MPAKEPPDSSSELRLAFMREILGAIADGVMVIDPKGEAVYANQSLCRILGCDRHMILGRAWTELCLHDEHNQELCDAIAGVTRGRKQGENTRMVYLTPDGARRELIATTNLIQDAERKHMGVVLVLKDISALKTLHKRERATLSRSRRIYEERRLALDRIARAIAHELRNPVTSIGGLTRRLLEGHPQGGKEHDYLERILVDTTRLEEIVRQVREYTSLRAPHMQRVDLARWLPQQAQRYQDTASRQGVKLSVIAPGPSLVQMDPRQIGQALDVIVTNSLEAMPRGGELELELGGSPDERLIMVNDTGRGIAADELPYIFDPFFTTKAEAVGMSLAMAKRIMNEHQGLLEITSQPGQGTRVVLGIPAAGPMPAP